MSTRSKNKREAQKFRSVINALGYESIGDFIELTGGIVSMLIQSDESDENKENIRVMGEQLVMHTGIIIEQIGHLDKVIERNEDLKKAAEKAKENREKKDKAIAAAAQAQAEANPIITKPTKNDKGEPLLFAPDGSVL